MMDDINVAGCPIPNQEYKVLVRCFTYNQSQFIEETLNGFAIQKTNFPFVTLVMDDASTDGAQEVIKIWMAKECKMSKAETIDTPTSIVILVPHKSNTSCMFAFYFFKQNLYKAKEEKMKHVTPWREKCEYEAVCEGDDYWIDPLKLQKQVDYMDINLDCGLVWGQARVFMQDRQSFDGIIGAYASSFDDLINNNLICTLTTLYRTNILPDYDDLTRNQRWLMGDYPLWLYIATKYKIHFINDQFAVYRVLTNSASHSQSYAKRIAFLESTYEIKCFFLDYVRKEIPSDVMMKKNQEAFDIAFNCREYTIAVTLFKQLSIRHRSARMYIKFFLSVLMNLKNRLV